MSVTDRQTDMQTPGDGYSALCIASRGKTDSLAYTLTLMDK